MNRLVTGLILALFSLPLVLVFQNCGEVRVKGVSTAELSSYEEVSVGALCAPESVEVSIPQKIIMILDMSASNLSRWQLQEGEPDANGMWYSRYYIGPGALAQCLEAKESNPALVCPAPTDVPGNRFAALNKFLNSCPQNEGLSNKYAVIGFGTEPMAPKNINASCEDGLVDKATALLHINGLKALQDEDLAEGYKRLRTGGDPYPFNLTDTSYQNAFQCLSKKINNDVNPEDLQRQYKVLFITDGKPSDNLPNSTYVTRLTGIKSFLQTLGYSLMFQPIYYGESTDTAQRDEAVSRMNEMAVAVQGTGTTIVLDPSVNFMEQLSDSLCRTPVETIRIPFEIVGSPTLFPVSSLQLDDQLYNDNDMDGVADDLETSYGFDFNKSRTGKLLDGLCQKFYQECQEFERSTIICSTTNKIGFGFTECDQKFVNEKILKINNNDPVAKKFDGLDFDNDSVLDYVEIVKGSDLFQSDIANDLDGDGISNGGELQYGLDPQSFTSDEIKKKFKQDYRLSNQSSCNSSGFSLSMTHLILTDNTAYSDAILTSHAANENVFLVTYKAKPAVLQSDAVKTFGQYLKITKDQTHSLSLPFEIRGGAAL